MGLKIFLKQLLHTPDNNPLEMVESPNPGVYRPAVKVPDIEEVFGAINETKVTDPDAAEASALGLLRGLLAALQAQAGDTNLGDLAALLTAINQKDIANQTTAAAILTALQGVLNVNLNGSLMELYGATVDNRPAADSVPVGACFMAVNTGQVWQSNGSDWVVRA